MATKKTDSKPSTGKKPPGFLKKITVKEVCGVPLLKDIPEGEILPLLKIAGYAQGVREGESNYGPWKAIMGEFAAVNLKSGEIFHSPVAIVPSAYGELLVQQTYAALHNDATSRVKFAVEIGVQVSKRDPNKYEYCVTPIQEPDTVNPAVALLGLST